MNVKITYPKVIKKNRNRRRMLQILRWPFMGAAFTSVVVNICVGGVAWSAIVCYSLFAIWRLIFALDLVEYNRISQFIKATVHSCVLIGLIHYFITPIWALGIVAILCYGTLIVSGILFLTDIRRQKQNMLPMFLFIVIAIIVATIGFIFSDETDTWTIIVLAAIALVYIFVCIFTLRLDFLREIKKRFHIK